jgi:hypothetical protein
MMVAITLSARAIQGNNTMNFGRVEWDKETEDKGTNIEYLNTYNVQLWRIHLTVKWLPGKCR